MNSEKIENFKDLRIWQQSIELVEEIYRISKEFPKEELYGIVNQIRRSAVSFTFKHSRGLCEISQ